MSEREQTPADKTAANVMADLTRRLAFSALVRDWCEQNHGCSDVPCSCDRRFVPPQHGDSGEVTLTSRYPRLSLAVDNGPLSATADSRGIGSDELDDILDRLIANIAGNMAVRPAIRLIWSCD